MFARANNAQSLFTLGERVEYLSAWDSTCTAGQYQDIRVKPFGTWLEISNGGKGAVRLPNILQ